MSQDTTIKQTAAANAALQFLQIAGVPTAVQTAAFAADAWTQPEVIFEQQKDFFAKHDITSLPDNLCETILFLSLRQFNLIDFVDWKEVPEEVLAKLTDLVAPHERSILIAYQESCSDELYPNDVIAEVNNILAVKARKVFLFWDFGGDEYVFFAVPVNEIAKLQEASATIGITIQIPIPESGEAPTFAHDKNPSIKAEIQQTDDSSNDDDNVEEKKGNGTVGCLIILVFLGGLLYGVYSLGGWLWNSLRSLF